jgi:hypothetical protein
MRWAPCRPPRLFHAGRNDEPILDVGRMTLATGEQITFARPSGAEYDVVAKDWGFYATPSVNGRLLASGMRAALVRSTTSARRFVLLVENGYEASFNAYLQSEHMVVEAWLDTTDVEVSG